jgi:WhiB family transcriptional regulator, redox-sensing transcriptional regulator
MTGRASLLATWTSCRSMTRGVRLIDLGPPGLTEQHWDWHWRRQAACLDADPEMFYPETLLNQSQVHQAKMVCAGCTVREQCLKVALDSNDDHGIWGGLTPQERRMIDSYRCLWCGAPLLMWRRDRKYCNAVCANRYASRQRSVQWLHDKRARQCVQCGGDIPPTRRADSMTCSRECNTKLQNQRGTERRRAAAKRQGPVVA